MHTTFKESLNKYPFPPQICFHRELSAWSWLSCPQSSISHAYQSDVNPPTNSLHLHMHTAGDGWLRIGLCIFQNPANRKQQRHGEHYTAPNPISRTPLWPLLGEGFRCILSSICNYCTPSYLHTFPLISSTPCFTF